MTTDLTTLSTPAMVTPPDVDSRAEGHVGSLNAVRLAFAPVVPATVLTPSGLDGLLAPSADTASATWQLRSP